MNLFELITIIGMAIFVVFLDKFNNLGTIALLYSLTRLLLLLVYVREYFDLLFNTKKETLKKYKKILFSKEGYLHREKLLVLSCYFFIHLGLLVYSWSINDDSFVLLAISQVILLISMPIAFLDEILSIKMKEKIEELNKSLEEEQDDLIEIFENWKTKAFAVHSNYNSLNDEDLQSFKNEQSNRDNVESYSEMIQWWAKKEGNYKKDYLYRTYHSKETITNVEIIARYIHESLVKQWLIKERVEELKEIKDYPFTYVHILDYYRVLEKALRIETYTSGAYSEKIMKEKGKNFNRISSKNKAIDSKEFKVILDDVEHDLFYKDVL